jgi:hypothetical protein
VDRRQLLPWLVIVLVAAASLGLTAYRLVELPELGMTLGPDLRVRSVSNPTYTTSETPKFKRGDRLVALEGHALQEIRDLRVMLRNLPPKQKHSRGEDEPGLAYQIGRPLHRYTIALQGNREDPTALPPGYDPQTDRLVEIDGRPLPDRVGPAGLRSIIGSRPDALLTFERRNAVFQGNVAFEPSALPTTVAIVFALAILVVVLLWLYHARNLHRWASLAVSVETVAFAWIVLLAVAPQWLLADWVLASGVIVSLVLARPLAIFARSKAARRRDDTSGWWALGLGVGYGALVVGLLHGGVLENAERALYAAASGAALYLIYELIMLAFDDAPHLTLREGRGYLGGILIVGIATAVFSWNFQPVAFQEYMWRWYTIASLALVWFGDALFCLRGPSSVGYAEVETSEERRESLRQYLEILTDEIKQARLLLVVRRGDAAAQIELEDGAVEVSRSEDAIADLVDILIQEKSRIPLPETADRSTNPLAGIAQTMNIVLALRLHPPSGGISLPGTEVALVGVETSDAGELPSYASVETIEFAQQQLRPSVWAAAFVEGMAVLSEQRAPKVQPASADEPAADISADETEDRERTEQSAPEVEELEREVETLETELQESDAQLEKAREKIELLREDRSALATQIDQAERRLRRHVPPIDARDELLEPELVETLEYLLESDEPIVVGGPYGAGKEYVARCAADIEGQPPEAFVVYDAFDASSEDHRVALFGEHGDGEGAPGEGLIDAAAGASLLIRSAGRLSDTLLMGLCNSAEEHSFRLYLTFQEPDIEERSVLEERPDNLADRLEHRELVLPGLQRRRTVLPRILEFYRERYARLRDRRISGFTDRAMEALEMYDYPAQIPEAKLLVDLAVLRTTGDEIDLPALNLDVRRRYERKTASPDDTNQ